MNVENTKIKLSLAVALCLTIAGCDHLPGQHSVTSDVENARGGISAESNAPVAESMAPSRGPRHTEAESTSAASSIPPPALHDLGNGLRFPVGQSIDEFKTKHPTAQCFDSNQEVICEIKAPSASDCPSGQTCDYVMYFFIGRAIRSFNANYPLPVWRELSTKTERKYGKPVAKIMRFHAMVTRVLQWQLDDGNILAFTHYSGGDINGNGIAHPYMITFAPADNSIKEGD